jgi:hypothetical protein
MPTVIPPTLETLIRTQAQLAEDMQRLGFPWLRETVGQVEAGRRRITLEEAFALSVVLYDHTNELFRSPGPIRLSDSWEVAGVHLGVDEEGPSQLVDAIRQRDHLRDEVERYVKLTDEARAAIQTLEEMIAKWKSTTSAVSNREGRQDRT